MSIEENSNRITEFFNWLMRNPLGKCKTIRNSFKMGRNELCSCGSGKKYKKCCLLKESKPVTNLFKKEIEKKRKYLLKAAKKEYKEKTT